MDTNIIVLEGCDRSAKTTVANYYKSKGYEVVHFGAPDKKYAQPGYTGPSYLDDLTTLFLSFHDKKVCLDRSHYGELVWPAVYGRQPLLDDEDLEVLKELLDVHGCSYILMYDENVEAHWKRCEDNNEPLTRQQFYKAIALYDQLAKNHGFTKKQLKDFPISAAAPTQQPAHSPAKAQPAKQPAAPKQDISLTKLEKANAINSVLSKRILKRSGGVFDELENDLRKYLSDKLSTILGDKAKAQEFSADEVQILKIYCSRIKEKANAGR